MTYDSCLAQMLVGALDLSIIYTSIRFMIGEKSHCTIFAIDSTNSGTNGKNSTRGLFSDHKSESLVKILPWDFSPITSGRTDVHVQTDRQTQWMD
jgi:hypothetical protein